MSERMPRITITAINKKTAKPAIAVRVLFLGLSAITITSDYPVRTGTDVLPVHIRYTAVHIIKGGHQKKPFYAGYCNAIAALL
jgi:hypothetical protein